MQYRAIVQVAGLCAIVSIALIQTTNGISREVVIVLWSGVLAIAAPQAFEQLLDRWGGE